MSAKPVVLRLGSIGYAREAWKALGEIANIVTVDESTTRDKFLKELKDPKSKLHNVQVITRTFESVEQTGRFDKELAQALPSSVVAVCHLGAGYDQIDTEPFKERHIQVTHTPRAVNNATADTHVFLLLGALRNYGAGIRPWLKGEWPAKGPKAGAAVGHDPEGHVVGILGLGGIGHTIANKLKPFGFKKIIYHNRKRLPAEQEYGCEYATYEEFLRTADIISINIPLNSHTKHLINEEAISKMKDGVVIVNTARGAIIDEQALIKALKSGKVRSFGADVFENEPQVPQELLDMPQVIGLPHMGTYTVETMKHMEEFLVQNAESVITTGKGAAVVPEMKGEAWVDQSKPLV
ncbi:GOR1 (YNL274C) [Zygosaccharomyces parabailii]|uniref:ZYBA0S14-01134g1_1 n=1 Tax=Zygosaccharomyces bailii (strain CLIB 213 / ATCC 58445 / CBS 680 / BCRC 21525 / NBRC 1098 / NCYC 1416 / NRRL Y-2227) TaxID=1333698 RepID=A0A8J2XAQ4_ZYGB2|nr:GOR1 (YNL274C) [Zygosaccharomyces parabailii]CDF91789.1 ZYBA0S14-01134g1_1 [Zygosaccharomyces bailii CLIB 213]CDH09777.1 probable Glyoxylate reductase 1 [Zygosaccharomyces bailii ISA1307]